VDVFFADYWRRRMLSLQLPESELAQVAGEVGALDMARIAGMAQGGVQAWVANEHVLHSVIPVDVSTAGKALSIGATLYFIDLPLDRLKNSLATFLGARPQNIVASLFLTPAGGGASWHFDANENFTVQLTGAKRWMIGAAPAVDAAPEAYVLGLRVPDSLTGLIDDIKPEPAHAIDMIPGTFLYVPRGTLHRTEAKESSWSLNLSYGGVTWIDVICSGLRDRLAGSARWRGTVQGLGDVCEPAARAANMLPDLAQELRVILAEPDELEAIGNRFLDHVDTQA
jgi:50S ribosomal protein L16 3-hydroxylase